VKTAADDSLGALETTGGFNMDEWPHLIIERQRTRDRIVYLLSADGELCGHDCYEVRPEGEGLEVVGTNRDYKTDWRRVLVHWRPGEPPQPIPTELATKAIKGALDMIATAVAGSTL
jgi:hypothetical protein